MSSKPRIGQHRSVSPTQIAKAVVGFNRADNLTPTARRLGIELVGHVNKQTFRCDPSEARLAHLLAVSDRAIRKAKTKLYKQDLITWRSSGQNGTCNYHIYWDVLARIADEKHASWRKKQEERMFQSSGTPVPIGEEREFRQTIPSFSH